MRADPAWQQARAIPRAQKQERARAFSTLRERYGFSEYALHEAAKQLRVCWIAEHLDAVLAQTLASRAYRSISRVCLGQDRPVPFINHYRLLSTLYTHLHSTRRTFY